MFFMLGLEHFDLEPLQPPGWRAIIRFLPGENRTKLGKNLVFEWQVPILICRRSLFAKSRLLHGGNGFLPGKRRFLLGVNRFPRKRLLPGGNRFLLGQNPFKEETRFLPKTRIDSRWARAASRQTRIDSFLAKGSGKRTDRFSWQELLPTKNLATLGLYILKFHVFLFTTFLIFFPLPVGINTPMLLISLDSQNCFWKAIWNSNM